MTEESNIQDNPGLYVACHFTNQVRQSYSTTSMGYGGFGGPVMGSSTTQEFSYDEGSLMVDASDSAEKKMVWRGSGTVTVKNTPNKQVKQVEKILKKLGNKWDKILAGKGK